MTVFTGISKTKMLNEFYKKTIFSFGIDRLLKHDFIKQMSLVIEKKQMFERPECDFQLFIYNCSTHLICFKEYLGYISLVKNFSFDKMCLALLFDMLYLLVVY